MKKVFQLVMAVLFVLPLMTACKKDHNSPDGPSSGSTGSEEWFDDWIDEEPTGKVAIEEENLCGIWQLMTVVQTDSLQDYSTCNYILEEEGGLCYFEIKANNTFIFEEYDPSLPGTSYKDEGVWELTGKLLAFERYSFNTGRYFSFIPDGYKIYRLTKTELALIETNKDKVSKYYIFTRLEKRPDMPVTTDEALASHSWKVTGDSVYTYKYEEYVDEMVSMTVIALVEIKRVDMLPKNSVITFAKDSVLEVKDGNGNLIGKAKWAVRQDLGDFILLDVLDENGIRPEDGETEIIPGLCSFFMFRMIDSGKKALISYEDVLPDTDAKGATHYGWFYHLEAVK